jgi:integrase
MSVDRRPNGTYRVRWREHKGGPQKVRTFNRKADADRFDVEIRHKLLSGTYTDPRGGEIPFGEYVRDLLHRRSYQGATLERIERELRLYILPAFEWTPLLAVRTPAIERWAASLPLAPSSVGTVAATLSAVLSAAVEDEKIPRNPASPARLPAVEEAPVVPLTAEHARAFIGAFPEHIRAAALLAYGTGMRQGEVFGLSVDRVDFLRRELRVDRQLWTPDKGPAVLVPPKSKKSYRTIALSGVVLDGLAAHLATRGAGQWDLVFHQPGGRPILRGVLSAYVQRARARAGIGAERTWHDFRHHHASLLLSQGVSPALVAERLGHDLKTLLKTYAHVIRTDDDRVRAVVDGALGVSAEDYLRTGTISA